MSSTGKKYQQAKDAISFDGPVSWREGVDAALKSSYAKFDESMDIDIVLGIDPTKGDQVVRGSVLLPHGTGKKVRIAVFAKGDHAQQATDAGADFVGVDELIEKIEGGWMDFDVAVATPDLMGRVGKVAKVLGPRGLLPNKKVGTVTFDISGIVSELKQGRVAFRNDKGGVVHASFGKVSFGVDKLLENLTALVKSVVSHKPSSAKGRYIKKISIASTMGVGVQLSPDQAV